MPSFVRLFSGASAPALAALALAACGGGSSMPGPAVSSGVTFHKDIEPILQQHCQNCHSAGHIAPFSLITYQDAKAVVGPMVVQTQARTMPPWSAQSTANCQPRFGWQDDKRLTDAQISTIQQWAMAGAPEGDPKDAPPPYVPPADGLPGVQMTLAPAEPFVAGGDSDQYQCFVMDPQFTQSMFLNGWHFEAGNARVVHHALMFMAATGDKAKTLAAVNAVSGGKSSYPCFGGPGVSAALVGAWAPGSVPAELPANVATTVASDAVFVMQVHYHPAGLTGQSDSTKFQMRFLPAAPEWQLLTSLIGNMDSFDPKTGDGLQPDQSGEAQFLIPANDSNKQIRQIFTIPATLGPIKTPEFRMFSVGTHMHYVGRDMRISVERSTRDNGDPASECLIETPNWNFNWQRWYVYDTDIANLPRINPGDKLHIDCTYDNSMANPFVVTALQQQHLSAPRDVSLGESTLDEMCLGVFGTIFKL